MSSTIHNQPDADAGVPAWLPLEAPVRRRSFLGLLGAGGVAGALAASLPASAAQGATATLLNGGKIMLHTLACDSFAPYVGSDFVLQAAGGAIPARLFQAKPLNGSGRGKANGRPPFSLLFRVAARSGLTQRIYALSHAAIGSMELFLVPVRADGEGLVLEAIFN